MRRIIWAGVLAVVLGITSPAWSREEQPANSEDAKYTQTIEKRTADILAALALTDAAKAKQAHDAVMAHYRALHDWQAANETKLKDLAKQKGDEAKTETASIMALRKALHDPFIAQLSAALTPEQVEIVKDKLTYNKVKVTYDSYCAQNPDLTDVEKAKILALLKEAREEAVEGVSADDKSAIFKKYKGKINNYLATQSKAAKQTIDSSGNGRTNLSLK